METQEIVLEKINTKKGKKEELGPIPDCILKEEFEDTVAQNETELFKVKELIEVYDI